jgi:hypothetical protein
MFGQRPKILFSKEGGFRQNIDEELKIEKG